MRACRIVGQQALQRGVAGDADAQAVGGTAVGGGQHQAIGRSAAVVDHGGVDARILCIDGIADSRQAVVAAVDADADGRLGGVGGKACSAVGAAGVGSAADGAKIDAEGRRRAAANRGAGTGNPAGDDFLRLGNLRDANCIAAGDRRVRRRGGKHRCVA